jgi:hypothetical protein
LIKDRYDRQRPGALAYPAASDPDTPKGFRRRSKNLESIPIAERLTLFGDPLISNFRARGHCTDALTTCRRLSYVCKIAGEALISIARGFAFWTFGAWDRKPFSGRPKENVQIGNRARCQMRHPLHRRRRQGTRPGGRRPRAGVGIRLKARRRRVGVIDSVPSWTFFRKS